MSMALGPRAFTVFEQMGIEVYLGSGTVREAVQKYLSGELKKITAPSGPMGINKSGMGMGFGPGGGRGAGRGMGRGRR